MSIRIAEHAGFCFGVRRAADTLEQEIERCGDGRRILTLGRLIHNDWYISRMKARGVEEISRDDVDSIISEADKGAGISVIIRAHGEKKDILEKLRACAERNPGFRLLDCTCPYVTKVRSIAEENSGDGDHFILLGSKTHPEVEGIMSCAGSGEVLSSYEEVEKWIAEHPDFDRCGKCLKIAAQTTQNLDLWRKSVNLFKKVYTNVIIFDTICGVTKMRQDEASRLSGESDAMIVIGSPDSSNSCKLRDIAREKCADVYFISDASQCPKLDVGNIRLSITAGASTPFSLIEEVYKTMNEQNENFAELLETAFKTLNTGEIVEGIITSITPTEIHVDLGTKTTGVIAHDKATDDPQAKLDQLFKVGDVIKAKVVKVSDIDGIATLDKTRVDNESHWEKIVEAKDTNETLEGKVVEVVNGGVILSTNSVRVFIPASLSGLPKGADLHELLNTTQKVKIVEIKPERKRAYASIRAVQREERRAKQEEFWNTIEVGKEFDGEVKSLTDFGAFVDLGGVDGMVHTSELSWRRIRHPKEVVSVGDKIHVFVKSFDREKSRISLGYKTDAMNPWTIFTSQYNEGDVVSVKIVSLMPFGAFAEILPGCDGLIHISQITDHKIGKPDEVIQVGQVVDAKITAIDNENHKISLSMRALIEPETPAEAPEAPVEERKLVYSDDEPVAEAAEAVAEEATEKAETVAEKAAEAVEEVKEAAENVIDKAKEAAEEVKETAEAVAEDAKETVKETVETVVEQAKEKVSETKEAVKETAEAVVEEAKEKAAEVKETVKETAETVIEQAKEKVAEAKGTVKETAETVIEQAKEKVSEAKEEVKEATEAVAEKVNKRVRKTAKAADEEVKEAAEAAEEVKDAVDKVVEDAEKAAE